MTDGKNRIFSSLNLVQNPISIVTLFSFIDLQYCYLHPHSHSSFYAKQCSAFAIKEDIVMRNYKACCVKSVFESKIKLSDESAIKNHLVILSEVFSGWFDTMVKQQLNSRYAFKENKYNFYESCHLLHFAWFSFSEANIKQI